MCITVCALPSSGTNPPDWCVSACTLPSSGTNPPDWCVSACTLPSSGTNPPDWCVSACTLPPSGTNPPHWCVSLCTLPSSGTNPPHWCVQVCTPHPVVPTHLTGVYNSVHPPTQWYQPTSLVCINTNPPHWCVSVCTLPPTGTYLPHCAPSNPMVHTSLTGVYHSVHPKPDGTYQPHWCLSQYAPSNPMVYTSLTGVYHSMHPPTRWYIPASLVFITVCTLQPDGIYQPHWCLSQYAPSNPMVHTSLTGVYHSVHPPTRWYIPASLVFITVCTLQPNGTYQPHWCLSQCAPSNPMVYTSLTGVYHSMHPPTRWYIPASLVFITVCTLQPDGTYQPHWCLSQCAPSNPMVYTSLTGVYHSMHPPTRWYIPASLVFITVCTLQPDGIYQPHWCLSQYAPSNPMVHTSLTGVYSVTVCTLQPDGTYQPHWYVSVCTLSTQWYQPASLVCITVCALPQDTEWT